VVTRLLLAGVVAVLGVGCTNPWEPPDGEPLPEGVAEAELAEWQARGLPAGDCESWELRIQWHPYEDLEPFCGRHDWGVPIGCAMYQDGQGIMFVQPGDMVTLQHELRHWLGKCSGLGEDPWHEDERFWYGGVL
jgi:hypothetical protein